MTRFVLLLFIVVSFFTETKAEKETVASLKIGIFSVTDSLETANELISINRFGHAIRLLQELERNHPLNVEVKLTLGYCYIKASNTELAVAYLEHLLKSYYNKELTSKKYFTDAKMLFAMALYYDEQFVKAIDIFNEVKILSTNKTRIKETDQFIKFSETAIKIKENPKDVTIEPFVRLNSNYHDHSPLISADESIIYFTSRRKGSTGGLRSPIDSMFYEDIYMLDLNKENNAVPQKLSTRINTNGHDATCGISMDGQELLIYKSTNQDDGDIFHTQFKRGEWSKPKRLGGGINSDYKESHAAFSADGKQIFVTSNRKGGYGGMDIYVSEKQKNGSWGPAKNLGNNINTPKDEESPYMHADGINLYFSSMGHETMGGFDIFASQLQADGTWSEASNIGYPLNSVYDDVFLVPSNNGKRAYFSSLEDGESNIYIATTPESQTKEVKVISGFVQNCNIVKKSFHEDAVTINADTLHVGLLSWVQNNITYIENMQVKSNFYQRENFYFIIDSMCQKPQDTKVTVFKLSDKKIDAQFDISQTIGKFQFVINPKEAYLLQYKADGFMYKTQRINKNVAAFENQKMDVKLDTITDSFIAHKSIMFPVAELKLTKESELDLELLTEFLKQYPDIYLDISEPNNSKNKELVQQRIKNVTNSVIDSGIKEYRIFSNLWYNPHESDTLQLTVFSSAQLAEQMDIKYIQRKILAPNDATNGELFNEKDLEKFEISEIFFNSNDYNLDHEAETLLKLSDYLKQHTGTIIMIEGHSDSKGLPKNNLKISRERAMAVWHFFINHGVSVSQLVIQPMSDSKRIAKDKTDDGEIVLEALKYNRRVTFKTIVNHSGCLLKIKKNDVPKEYRF